MSREPCKIIDDPRPIQALHFNDPDGSFIRVGSGDVTAIVPYEECGEMAMVTWLAVYSGDEIIRRMPARIVEIDYQ